VGLEGHSINYDFTSINPSKPGLPGQLPLGPKFKGSHYLGSPNFFLAKKLLGMGVPTIIRRNISLH